ncbi:hypothetical protein DQ04_04331090 [Trypanosoma grayi]|uniref:hypothetical protein n=1 Tax=Trypanosoma grayi TaxID=71804 RepID=UPI0004F4695D|nr:hypothetical protein DQ04_04331090 [Trypanosoma grayi]KEG09995.1 hypothetical protein DQ04_04331090 [Trypanosoma grayi]
MSTNGDAASAASGEANCPRESSAPDVAQAVQATVCAKTYSYTQYTPAAAEPVACVSDGAWEVDHPSPTVYASQNAVARMKEATRLYKKAESAVANGLAKCGDWLSARDLFYEAGAIFATGGYAEDAAKAFLHAGIITRAFKNEEEMVTAMSLAAENLQVVQPALAVDVLHSLANSLVAAGHPIQSARCKREAALLLEQRLAEPAKAIQLYREAMELYGNRVVTKSFSRNCMERISALTVELQQYTEASQLYIEEASMVPRNLPKTQQYLYSLLCMLAEGFGNDDRYFDALYVTRKRFDTLQEEEKNFQQGKEHQLMRRLIEANDHGSLNEFDIAVFEYKSCASFKPDSVFDVLAERCRANLYEHVEQYM